MADVETGDSITVGDPLARLMSKRQGASRLSERYENHFVGLKWFNWGQDEDFVFVWPLVAMESIESGDVEIVADDSKARLCLDNIPSMLGIRGCELAQHQSTSCFVGAEGGVLAQESFLGRTFHVDYKIPGLRFLSARLPFVNQRLTVNDLEDTRITGKPDLDINVEPAAREFCRQRGLEGELKQAIDLALVSFIGTERLSLWMMEDPYDQEAAPTIVAELQSPLLRREFRDANSRFFRMLREEGCERFHSLLAVLQE